MTTSTDSISEQAAIDKIVAELLARGLIDPSQQAQLAAALTSGVFKAEDWRFLAEKALMLGAKGHG
jgi:hypothetical protein